MTSDANKIKALLEANERVNKQAAAAERAKTSEREGNKIEAINEITKGNYK